MATLEEMLEMALWPGGKGMIEELQTATGTKDKIAQYWIDLLLSRAKKARSDDPTRLPDNIADELRTWLHAQPGSKLNPLLDLIGKLTFVSTLMLQLSI
jgi:hypothetical protein